MLYTNWDDRFDPDYCEDEKIDFYITMLCLIEDLVSTLEEMRVAFKHEIERKQYLD